MADDTDPAADPLNGLHPNEVRAAGAGASSFSTDGRDNMGTGGREPARPSRLRRQLIAGDVLALVAVWGGQAFLHGGMATEPRIASAAIAIICTLGALHRAGLYRSRVCALRSFETVNVVGACAVGATAFAVGEWLAGSTSAWQAVGRGAIASAAILALRWRFGRWLKAKHLAGRYLRPVVLVGTNDDAAALYTILSDEPELGYRVAAVAGPPRAQAPWDELPACVEMEKLGALAAGARANGVIVVVSALEPTSRSQAVHQALTSGLHVQLWTGFSALSGRRMRIVPATGVPLFYVEPQTVAPWQLAVKRLMDIVIASVTAVLLAPVLLLVALMIRLDDGGPVIYRHRVVGRFGAQITVLKFRSMVPNASTMTTGVVRLNERVGGPLFKASHDPRVTRVGRVLRATSIDELPQLWNVLNGTMSMVGPRFALPSEVEQFDEELCRRHQMRPGITGLWQSEARDNPSFSAYRRLDLLYIDNWSLGLDVAILVNTAHSVSVRALREFRNAVRSRRANVGFSIPDGGSLSGSAAATESYRRAPTLSAQVNRSPAPPRLRLVGKTRHS